MPTVVQSGEVVRKNGSKTLVLFFFVDRVTSSRT